MLHYETKLLSSKIFIFYRNKYEYSKSQTPHYYDNNSQTLKYIAVFPANPRMAPLL